MRKILVIDDDEEFNEFVKTNLELRGDYRVLTTSDGVKGIRLAEKNKPALILLDILMPAMDGFEVLKKLRDSDKTKNIPVIMLTARSDDEARAEALKLHDNGYIVKPLRIEELEEKIEEVLEKMENGTGGAS